MAAIQSRPGETQPGQTPPEQTPPPSPVYNPGQGQPEIQPDQPSEKTFDVPGNAPEIPGSPGGDEWHPPAGGQ